MRVSVSFLFLFVVFSLGAQTKVDYLKDNRYDLHDATFSFPEKEVGIVGFGAYHGSAKTEEVELQLIKSLVKDGKMKYYMPEMDFSTAYYFNQYLKTGNKSLLKDLVMNGTEMTPQDRSIETFRKWEALKVINDALPNEDKIEVLGIDIIANYTYSIKHLSLLIQDEKAPVQVVNQLRKAAKNDSMNMSSMMESTGKKVLRDFVLHYETNEDLYVDMVSNMDEFCHILDNVKLTLSPFRGKREGMIFKNFMFLKSHYDFVKGIPFVRLGFFHLEKEREGKHASFFTQLIEQEVYPREKVISIIGYLTTSEVLWDVNYDDKGTYIDHTIEGGYGIGDYEKEYFRGIDRLKGAAVSDMTLFKLNGRQTPYNDGNPDLIEIVMTDDASNGALVKGKSTTAFLDYAILISGSEANSPIELLNQ